MAGDGRGGPDDSVGTGFALCRRMSRRTLGLDDRLQTYVQDSQPPEHPALASLRAATATMAGAEMQIAPEQGHFLGFLVRLIGARRTLEIGTFTGYSALAVALALPADGAVTALDISEDFTRIAREYWRRAGIEGRIELRIGPALETLAALSAERRAPFDFAFIDAAKTEYDGYYEAVLDLLRPGGLIAFDNMLQDGDVADPEATGAGVAAIRALNAKLAGDERVDRVLLPIGDGMTLARKR